MAQLKKSFIIFVILLIITIVIFKINLLWGFIFIFAVIVFSIYINRASLYDIIGKLKYGKTGDIDYALKWFSKAYKTGKAKNNTVITYGYILLKSGDINEAKKVFDNLLESKLTEDEKMLTKSNYALVLWKKDKLDEAIQMLKEIMNDDFKTTNIYGSLGYFLIQKGDLDKALEFNNKAYEYNSSNTVILDNLGQTYYLKGNYEKAKEIYQKLMNSNPTFPEAYYNYGLVLEKLNQSEDALDYMEKALNYSFSFLSTVTKQEVEDKITKLKLNK